MNYNRMTIRKIGNRFEVFRMKRQRVCGWATDAAGCNFEWFVSAAAVSQYEGALSDCFDYIKNVGAEYMPEKDKGDLSEN